MAAEAHCRQQRELSVLLPMQQQQQQQESDSTVTEVSVTVSCTLMELQAHRHRVHVCLHISRNIKRAGHARIIAKWCPN